jgi:hypothetical protein
MVQICAPATEIEGVFLVSALVLHDAPRKISHAPPIQPDPLRRFVALPIAKRREPA